MDGLSIPIKESVKEYTSTKDIWFKLGGEYQSRSQYKEKETEVKDEKQGEKDEQASNASEGKKYYVGYNYDDIEIPFREDEKEDLLKVNNAFGCTLLDVDTN